MSILLRTATSVTFLLCTAVVVVAAPAPYHMKITFDGYTRSETLTNFPALVTFGGSAMPAGFDYGQFASTNGWDLRFRNADRTAELDYEIESWTTNGASRVWVKVPALSHSTHILAFWGQQDLASAPAPCTTNGATWSEGFVGVWHMNQVNALDSSPYRNHGVAAGSVVSATGVVGGADRFAYHARRLSLPLFLHVSFQRLLHRAGRLIQRC
jgi:hypothetical protein